MLRISLSVLLFFCLSTATFAAYSTLTPSGTWSHGGTVTITGSTGTGFGSKTTPAPNVWDDCSGTNPLTLWSGAWPDATAGSQPNYNGTYRTPASVGRGVSLPHSHVTKYFAGAHYPGTGYTSGYNVAVYKTFTMSRPMTIFASWYERIDPGWNSTLDNTDNNYKFFDYSYGGEPFEMGGCPTQCNWYINFAGTDLVNASSSVETTINDDGGILAGTSSLISPDVNGHSHWWNTGVNPMSQWVKREYEVRITNDNTGYIKGWENGILTIDYLGPTDRWNGTTRSVALGGYARDYPATTQWRYYNDLYFDLAANRVEVCTGSTWANHGLCELQIPTAWSTSSVTVTVNQGAHPDSSTRYLYVVDSSGAANANGTAIAFGAGSSDTTAPTITAFTIPSTASSLTVSISSFTATDDTGVTGYCLTETNNSATCSWVGSAPTSYTFATSGSKTLYAFARDAVPNVSTSLSANVTITLPSASLSGAKLSGAQIRP